VALTDRGESDHERCRKSLANLSGPMLTTWPAFTEAMYLLGDAGGWSAQELLWRLVKRRDLLVEVPARLERMSALMAKYADTPMDLADASLVVLAEERRLRTVFTLDEDFRVYRLSDGSALSIVP
jgi:predicted nucleic acid-binding protein